jgi:predicted DNA-binding transcriptional regulator YafY
VRVSGTGVASLRRVAEKDVDGTLEIPYVDLHWLARQVAAAGSAAHVVDPPELADAVVARLRAAAGSSQ